MHFSVQFCFQVGILFQTLVYVLLFPKRHTNIRRWGRTTRKNSNCLAQSNTFPLHWNIFLAYRFTTKLVCQVQQVWSNIVFSLEYEQAQETESRNCTETSKLCSLFHFAGQWGITVQWTLWVSQFQLCAVECTLKCFRFLRIDLTVSWDGCHLMWKVQSNATVIAIFHSTKEMWPAFAVKPNNLIWIRGPLFQIIFKG